MHDIFTELSVILVLAAAVAGITQALRQPLIIGHIVTGLLVGPYFLNALQSAETIDLFSQLGIALLLFIIGLSLNPRVIREVGAVSLVTGLGQVLFTTIGGYVIGLILGLDPRTALYVAIALTFSSTIIILKLLTDKKELGHLYGKIATGFLLVQDIVATLILIAMTALGQQQMSVEFGTTLLIKGAVLASVTVLVGWKIIPYVLERIAKSQELLFLFAIGWGLGLATLFHRAGFSVEIGALFAGVALASSPYSYTMSAKLRPLRDFFIILFFILLGSRLAFDNLVAIAAPATLLSLFVLIGNPLIVLVLMKLLGYDTKTGFKAGLTVAQISEFSLILILLAERMGHVSEEVISLVTLTGIITIAFSTYMILYADQLFELLRPLLRIFGSKQPAYTARTDRQYEAILLGFHDTGLDFIRSFQKLGAPFIVVDFDPLVIKELNHRELPHFYGDASDKETLDELHVEHAKLVVSTIRDYATNRLILEHARVAKHPPMVIVTATSLVDAAELYAEGAAYVMMPEYAEARRTSSILARKGINRSEFQQERKHHLEHIHELSSVQSN